MTHQTENGFTRIADSLLDAIALADLSKREYKVLLVVIRRTYGFGKRTAPLSASFIAAATGLDRAHIARTVSGMVQRSILTCDRTQAVNVIGINKRFFPFQASAKTTPGGGAKTAPVEISHGAETATVGGAETATLVVPKQPHKIDTLKDKDIDIYRSFDHFWHGFPRKVAKARAEKAWRNLSKTDQTAAIAALPHWPFSPETQFQPHATTWLNQRRWEDEPDQPPTTTRSNGNGRVNGYRENAGEWLERLERQADPRADGGSAQAIDGEVLAPDGGDIHGKPLARGGA